MQIDSGLEFGIWNLVQNDRWDFHVCLIERLSYRIWAAIGFWKYSVGRLEWKKLGNGLRIIVKSHASKVLGEKMHPRP